MFNRWVLYSSEVVLFSFLLGPFTFPLLNTNPQQLLVWLCSCTCTVLRAKHSLLHSLFSVSLCGLATDNHFHFLDPACTVSRILEVIAFRKFNVCPWLPASDCLDGPGLKGLQPAWEVAGFVKDFCFQFETNCSVITSCMRHALNGPGHGMAAAASGSLDHAWAKLLHDSCSQCSNHQMWLSCLYGTDRATGCGRFRSHSSFTDQLYTAVVKMVVLLTHLQSTKCSSCWTILQDTKDTNTVRKPALVWILSPNLETFSPHQSQLSVYKAHKIYDFGNLNGG